MAFRKFLINRKTTTIYLIPQLQLRSAADREGSTPPLITTAIFITYYFDSAEGLVASVKVYFVWVNHRYYACLLITFLVKENPGLF